MHKLSEHNVYTDGSFLARSCKILVIDHKFLQESCKIFLLVIEHSFLQESCKNLVRMPLHPRILQELNFFARILQDLARNKFSVKARIQSVAVACYLELTQHVEFSLLYQDKDEETAYFGFNCFETFFNFSAFSDTKCTTRLKNQRTSPASPCSEENVYIFKQFQFSVMSHVVGGRGFASLLFT